jgi:hypothetical protein
MDNIRDFLLLAKIILPGIGIVLFLWGNIDNYFLTRYGGKLNRGFTIWSGPLKPDEQQFLENLKEDVVDINKKRFGFQTRTKKSFIMVNGKDVLIRFSRMGQRTSWPLVGYVDLSLPKPLMEYRLSLPMLMSTILIMLVHIIVVVVLSVAFVLSWMFETGGLGNYLSQKADLYFVRQNSQKQKGVS